MSKAWDPDDVFDLLASEDVRTILAATSVRPMSAKELAAACDRSLATVYRRLRAIEEYDLVSSAPVRDPDGTQYEEYRSALNEVTVSVEQGQLAVALDVEGAAVDRFADRDADVERRARADAEDV